MNNTSINTLKVGTVLDEKWVILEFIAKGGMGEVYRAHQVNLKRDVVIKVISTEWLESCEDDEEEREIGILRFRNEVQAMSRVRHSNIAQIYDSGSVDLKRDAEDVPVEYIAMEYIPGSTLRETMPTEGFDREELRTKEWLIHYLLPVLNGVQTFHDFGIIHRDLKPENILLDGDTPKIVDFGLARSCQLKPVTQSIDAKGTPPYMSPEQFFDLKRTDHRADIYALGKILFEAIVGKITPKTVPFKSASLENAETPFFGKIDQIIQKATEEDRKERFGSVDEMRKALLEAIALAESSSEKKRTQGLESSTPKKFYSILAHPKWIWTGICIAVLSMGLMALWHLLGEPGKPARRATGPKITDKTFVQSKAARFSAPISSLPKPLPPILLAEDGLKLRLVQAGEITLPENFGPNSGKLVTVGPLYMDETQVTNHQYADFLNQLFPRITVEKGVVRGDVNIWLLLGEVVEGYDTMGGASPRLRSGFMRRRKEKRRQKKA